MSKQKAEIIPKLKYQNGIDISIDSQPYKKGRQWYVRNEADEEIEVFTATTLYNHRLKYANGESVPAEANPYQKDRQWFIRNEADEEIEVFTTTTLYNRRLKYANGESVPAEANPYQKDKKWFIRNEANEEIEVFTTIAFYGRRLKYANGESVSTEAKPYQKDRKWFVRNEANEEIEVFTTTTFNNRRLKYANGELVSNDTQPYKKGKQWFVRNEANEEIKVFTQATLCGRRLKYANGEGIPEEAEPYQKGSQWFVCNEAGEETEVFTSDTLKNFRLKYANGTNVDKDTQPYKKGQQWFVRNETGDELEVFTAATLKKSLLKYANGQEVPKDAQPYKKGRKWFVLNEAGDEIEAFSISALSHRRLQYASGENVPKDAQSYKKDKKWFVRNETGEEIEVFTAATLTQRRYKQKQDIAPVVEGSISDEASENALTAADVVVGGISGKYQRERVPRLPRVEFSKSTSQDGEPIFSSEHALIPLQELMTGLADLHHLPHVFARDGLSIRLSLYACNPIGADEQVVFIFSGRKEKAYVPHIEARERSNVRVVLVGTAEEFSLLKEYVQPGIDFLVLEELHSLTHGRYEKLGLLNSRRIAAFYYALHLHETMGLTHALMLDDNIDCLYSKTPMTSWDDYIAQLATEAHLRTSACVSIATVSNQGLRRQRTGELGSKCFLFDLALLRDALGTERTHWLLPFFPATANAFWGEDYYFQLMFEGFLSKQGKQGYMVLPAEDYGLKRASLPSLCRKVVKTADALCEVSFADLFKVGAISLLPEHRLVIEKGIDVLQQLIKENMALHQALLEKSKTKPLMMAHAWANHLVYQEPYPLPSIEEATFLAQLKEQLTLIQEQGHLHGYQKEILASIAAQLTSERERLLGHITMATGTGKTYVQIYLAIAALLTGTRRPIAIVTPYQHLVEQAWRDILAVLGEMPHLPISASQIVKVDAKETSIGIDALLHNRTLDGQSCIYIFCQESYVKLQKAIASAEEAAPMLALHQLALLLIDEVHMQERAMETIDVSGIKNTVILGLTATPKPHALWSFPDVVSMEYTREEAVAHDYLSPCIMDCLDGVYSREAVLQVIAAMPSILNRLLPSGGVLKDKKGIIYVPNNEGETNYSRQLKEVLTQAGIACFEINSNEPDAHHNLEVFKRYQDEAGPKILICKGMAKVGFSANDVHWAICIQPSDARQFAQAAGRTMRLLNAEKIAYVIGFKEAKTSLVFKNPGVLADDKALQRASQEYLAQRAANHGKIPFVFQETAVTVDKEGSGHRGKRKALVAHGFFKRHKAESLLYSEEIEELRRQISAAIAAGGGFFSYSSVYQLMDDMNALPNDEVKKNTLHHFQQKVLFPLLQYSPKLYHQLSSEYQVNFLAEEEMAVSYRRSGAICDN